MQVVQRVVAIQAEASEVELEAVVEEMEITEELEAVVEEMEITEELKAVAQTEAAWAKAAGAESREARLVVEEGVMDSDSKAVPAEMEEETEEEMAQGGHMGRSRSNHRKEHRLSPEVWCLRDSNPRKTRHIPPVGTYLHSRIRRRGTYDAQLHSNRSRSEVGFHLDNSSSEGRHQKTICAHGPW